MAVFDSNVFDMLVFDCGTTVTDTGLIQKPIDYFLAECPQFTSRYRTYEGPAKQTVTVTRTPMVKR